MSYELAPEWTEMYGQHKRTPEQKLCSAMIIRGLLDTQCANRNIKKEAMWWILDPASNFIYFAAGAGLNLEMVKKLQEGVRNGYYSRSANSKNFFLVRGSRNGGTCA
jgi:hypothetical protein